jgi:hypothetical protein
MRGDTRQDAQFPAKGRKGMGTQALTTSGLTKRLYRLLVYIPALALIRLVEISATDFDDTLADLLELSLPDLLRLLLVAHTKLIAARTKEGMKTHCNLGFNQAPLLNWNRSAFS